MKTLDTELAKEAKAIVALAFRNGPIEDVHAGKACLGAALPPVQARNTSPGHA